MKKIIFPALTAALFSSVAFSNSFKLPQDDYAYVAAEVGQSDIDAPGFDEGTHIAGTFGWRASKNFAFELSYSDFGESETTIADSQFSDLVADEFQDATLEFTGTTFDVSMLVIWPATDALSLFARVGFAFWDAELNSKGYGEEASFNGEDPVYGFGAEYRFSESFGATLNFKRYNFTDNGDDIVEIDGDIDAVTIGIKYTF